ncbi:MAG: Bug family tripartite tricarboxylate transporter substrate binding protein [Xanthobacteraceae bacterium]
MTGFRSLACIFTGAISVLIAAQPAAAEQANIIDRPIIIYVAGTAGGGIDLYGRLVSRHLGRHIPGNPQVTVQTMPGAGGIRAANFLARQAPKDGTAITTFAGGPILEPLIGSRKTDYDSSKLTWIGAISKDVGMCIAWAKSPFKTIQDVQKREMVVAGTGAGSDTDTWPVILNELIGTKFKLVTGYQGTQETVMAIERGEAHGRCTFSLSALRTAKPDWLRDKKINILLQLALEKHKMFPNVPLIYDLVTKPEDRQLLDLMIGTTAMARPFAGPPDLDPAKATLLRRGFDATMKDPEFLAEAKKIQAEVIPSRGEDVQKLVARLYATPKPVVERVKRFLAPAKKK